MRQKFEETNKPNEKVDRNELGKDVKAEKDLSTRSKLFSFASNFIAGMLVLAFVGYKIDQYRGSNSHLFLLLGIILGFIWSMYETFKLVRFLNK